MSRYLAIAIALLLAHAGNARAFFAPLPDNFFVEGWVEATDAERCIPSLYRSAALRALKPIKVCRDHVSIAAVTAVEEGCELGLYYVDAASSYLPVSSDGRTFKWYAEEQLMRFRFCEAASDSER